MEYISVFLIDSKPTETYSSVQYAVFEGSYFFSFLIATIFIVYKKNIENEFLSEKKKKKRIFFSQVFPLSTKSCSILMLIIWLL